MIAKGCLVTQAKSILRANDRGGFTVPAAGLYPFQWNWDAGISALGWATFDEPRAWQELESLFRGQWRNGMLPHIVFHKPMPEYFPGPDVWGVNHLPPTSAITQPPLLATVARIMYDKAKDKFLAYASIKNLLPKLAAYHRYCYSERDPCQSGLVTSFHPWESGMDNSPAWDVALERVPEIQLEYRRSDLQFVDREERPLKPEYDRYLFLVKLFRDLSFDDHAIFSTSPYKIQDVNLNAILLRANRDLLALCEELQYPGDVEDLRAYGERARLALAGLWSDAHKFFLCHDVVSGDLIPVRTTAGLMPLYSQAIETEYAGELAAALEQWLDQAVYGIASTHPREPEFDPVLYWRGPTWLHINWMIADGLGFYGFDELAARIKRASAECLNTSGFREYYESVNGRGLGGEDFSWTAAIALHWLL